MSTRRRILFLTPRVPFPPEKGEKIRTFAQLDHLAQGHDVYCACFVTTPADRAHAETLRRWCAGVEAVDWRPVTAAWRAGTALLCGGSLSCGAFRSPVMTNLLARWAAEIGFDVVAAFSSAMTEYALQVPARRHVLDLCDADSEKWFDYARQSRPPAACVWSIEGRRLRRLEADACRRFDAVIVVSDRERATLDPAGNHRSLHVVPNGVHVLADAVEPLGRLGPNIGFVGTMNYRPNAGGVEWFVRQVWPAIRTELPSATFTIVGRNPPRRVRWLGTRPGVTVTGTVADPNHYLRRMRVVVAPLHVARGVQNKVLEAMALGRPVVATTAVAGGLSARPGREIMVADSPREFARRVVELCRYDDLCDRIGAAGRRLAAARYGWPEALRNYERIVLGLPDTSPDSTMHRPETACAHDVRKHGWPMASAVGDTN